MGGASNHALADRAINRWGWLCGLRPRFHSRAANAASAKQARTAIHTIGGELVGGLWGLWVPRAARV